MQWYIIVCHVCCRPPSKYRYVSSYQSIFFYTLQLWYTRQTATLWQPGNDGTMHILELAVVTYRSTLDVVQIWPKKRLQACWLVLFHEVTVGPPGDTPEMERGSGVDQKVWKQRYRFVVTISTRIRRTGGCWPTYNPSFSCRYILRLKRLIFWSRCFLFTDSGNFSVVEAFKSHPEILERAVRWATTTTTALPQGLSNTESPQAKCVQTPWILFQPLFWFVFLIFYFGSP